LASARDTPEHLKVLADWLGSYRAGELFDENGKLHDWIAELAPAGHLRMSDNPHANGGLLLKDLSLEIVPGRNIIVTGANGDEVLKPFARQPRIHWLTPFGQSFDRVWPSRKFIPTSTTVQARCQIRATHATPLAIIHIRR
jgi:hypothetical protein